MKLNDIINVFFNLSLNLGEEVKCSRIAPPKHKQDATSGQKLSAYGHKYNAHGRKYNAHGVLFVSRGSYSRALGSLS